MTANHTTCALVAWAILCASHSPLSGVEGEGNSTPARPVVSIIGTLPTHKGEEFRLVTTDKEFEKLRDSLDFKNDTSIDFTQSFAVVIVTSDIVRLTEISIGTSVESDDLCVSYTHRYINNIVIGLNDKFTRAAYAVLVFHKSARPKGDIIIRCYEFHGDKDYKKKKTLAISK